MRVLLKDRHFSSKSLRFFVDRKASFPVFVYILDLDNAFVELSSELGEVDVLLEQNGYHTIYGNTKFYDEAYGGVSSRVSSGDWEEVLI